MNTIFSLNASVEQSTPTPNLMAQPCGSKFYSDAKANATKPSNAKHRHYEQGFTLIELMVSLVIGLLISAAAVQLFINSANSTRVQAAVADIQDAAVFSMTYMKKEIAMANLGASAPMTQTSPWTGVVLTGSIGGNATPRTGNLRGVTGVPKSMLTLSGPLITGETAGFSRLNNVVAPSNSDQLTINSDQLTIQYQAPFDGTDCEGDPVQQGDIVIERFFTRRDDQAPAGEAAKLRIALACDAGHYRPPANTDVNNIIADNIAIAGFGDNGQILVNRVDDFEVLLGVQRANGIEYMSIGRYTEPNTDNITYKITDPIVAIQFAVIARGTSPVSGVTKTVYKVNGVNRTIDQGGTSYVRRVYQSVVNLRNSGGIS